MNQMKKEEYLDVKIINQRNEQLKKQHKSIETGCYINGTIVEFEEKEALDSIFLMMPSEFTLMPDELVKIKYPFDFRPLCVLTNDELTVNFNFNEFRTDYEEKTMKQLTEMVKETLEIESDTFDFGEIKELSKIDGYYFDFRQNVIDGKLYHMVANFKLNQQVYQFTFNCLLSAYSDWKQAVLQVWSSTKYKEM